MQFRPGTIAMTVMLATLTSLGPLSTDMYLPSLPWIARDFGVSDADAQFTLSIFLVGFAAGQLLFGPISDTYGRKPVLTVGLVVFTVATAFCYFAPSIEMLAAARFGQAIGACAGVVLARAIVRDLYGGAQAARLLSIMAALMGAVPAVAPILGGVLHETFGWRANFAVITICALAVLVVTMAGLPETNARRHQSPLSFSGMLASFSALLSDRVFRRFIFAAAFSYGGLFAFISGSSFVFQNHYELSPKWFGLVFAAAVGGYIGGTLIGARATTRRGIEHTLLVGAILLAAGGVIMTGLVVFAEPHYLAVLLPMIVYMAGVGLTLPQSMAGALTPHPERAGAASSLMGACQMTFGAVVGIIVGHNVEHGPITLAVATAVLGLGCVCVATLIYRRASA
jgi:DHA1 family bicyclomycin/chloramphenicol resistance-like MFS transporter